MAKVLVSMPGRAGDLLWALPTVRAIAESTGGPVDLQICGEFKSMVALLALQPYIDSVIPDDGWSMSATPLWRAPRVHDDEIAYDQIFNLGYRRWPELPLPVEIYQTILVEKELPPLDLSRPWISIDPLPTSICVVGGFSDCYFELKYGVIELLGRRGHKKIIIGPLPPAGSRWVTEGGYAPTSWLEAARWIAASKVFFGCCSALHVLAVAIGKPVIVLEPMEARHNPIFYPLGKVGPEVTLVLGNDGLPTVDARHCAEAIQKVLGR